MELRIFVVVASLNKLFNNQISGDAADLRYSNVTVMDDELLFKTQRSVNLFEAVAVMSYS